MSSSVSITPTSPSFPSTSSSSSSSTISPNYFFYPDPVHSAETQHTVDRINWFKSLFASSSSEVDLPAPTSPAFSNSSSYSYQQSVLETQDLLPSAGFPSSSSSSSSGSFCCGCISSGLLERLEMCGILCCFGCLTVLGCRDRVCQKLVFFPPKPMYYIEDNKLQQTMWLIDAQGKKIEPYADKHFKLAFVKTRRKQTVATMWISHSKATTTILFSHGNATDIGCMRDHLLDLSRQLKVNIMTYDYSGYGLSTGRPSMANTLADVESVYDYLVNTYMDRCDRIIAYGQSLGSGPTLHLTKVRPLSGVVIHSGLMSGLRVIRNVKNTSWFDIYPNVDIVKSVNAPLFVIHGIEDEEIPIHHGQGIAENAKNAVKPFFVEGAGHNNIEVQFRDQYVKELRNFVKFINSQPVTYNSVAAEGSPPSSTTFGLNISSTSSSDDNQHGKTKSSKHHHHLSTDSSETFDLTV